MTDMQRKLMKWVPLSLGALVSACGMFFLNAGFYQFSLREGLSIFLLIVCVAALILTVGAALINAGLGRRHWRDAWTIAFATASVAQLVFLLFSLQVRRQQIICMIIALAVSAAAAGVLFYLRRRELAAKPTETSPTAEISEDDHSAEPEEEQLEPPQSEDEEECRALVEKCMSVLGDMVEEDIPEEGYQRPCLVGCDNPGSDNRFLMKVECDRREPSKRSLWISASRNGSDLAVSNFLLSGTRAEILAYLRDESHLEPLVTQLVHLSATVDEKME